jgi:hypothetical protein
MFLNELFSSQTLLYVQHLIIVSAIVTGISMAADQLLIQARLKQQIPYRHSPYVKYAVATLEIALGILVARSVMRR